MSHNRFGAGFRTPHFADITSGARALDWFEVLTENFLGVGGLRRAMLERLRADHPIALHGVSLSIAGTDPLDTEYLRGLRALSDQVDPVFVSDHLCWTSLGGRQSHDLLPVALTAAVLDHVRSRIERVQELLGRRLTLENATVYVAFRGDELDEAEFFTELCRRTGCAMLLDVNNLYVNAQNLGVDPQRYLAALPREIVGYMHLAGHAVLPDVRIDTHDAEVPDPVWALFDEAVRRFPDADVIVERDDNIPEFGELRAEVELARERHARALVDAAERREVIARSARPASGASRSWSELQREFWNHFVNREPAHAALVDDVRPVSAARGMRVYSDAYAVNLRRALAENFPALACVIAPSDFAALCTQYLRRNPPRGHDFRSIGADLADFVQSFPFAHDYGIARDALADLVALEQAQLEVQDEIDEGEPLAPAALAALTPEQWERARFTFVRALRIVRTTHDVLPVVESVARGATPERPKPEPSSYLVFRGANQLRSERLTEHDADLLSAFFGGDDLAKICEGDEAEDRALAAVRILVDASQRGLLLSLDA